MTYRHRITRRGRKTAKGFALCIDNEEYPASLERLKLYELLPHADAARHDQVRIADESGEAYLYPSQYFEFVSVSPGLRRFITGEQTGLRIKSASPPFDVPANPSRTATLPNVRARSSLAAGLAAIEGIESALGAGRWRAPALIGKATKQSALPRESREPEWRQVERRRAGERLVGRQLPDRARELEPMAGAWARDQNPRF